MPVSYLGARDVLRAGIPIVSLCRFTGMLASQVAIGSTTLTLGTGSATAPTDLAIGDRITLFDGIASEVVRATSTMNGTTFVVSCTPLQYAHSISTEYALDGVNGGSLGDIIFRASGKLEGYARQSLLQQSYTDVQRLRITGRAIRRDGGLVLNPMHYPVQTLTTLTLQYDGFTDPLTLDPSQFIVDHVRERFFLPYLQFLEAAIIYSDDEAEAYGLAFGNGRGFLATLVYESGYPYGNLPGELAEAALLFVRAELSKSGNPEGVVSIAMNKRKVVYRNNNDSGEASAFEREACAILDNSYVKTGHRRV